LFASHTSLQVMHTLHQGLKLKLFHGPNVDYEVTRGPHCDFTIGPHYHADATMAAPEP